MLKHYCVHNNSKCSSQELADLLAKDGESKAPAAAAAEAPGDLKPRIEPHSINGPVFTPVEVAKLYGFPVGVDGSGQKVGIINLGGGYRSSDIQAYVASIGVSKSLNVVDVPVNGGVNNPDDASGASYEVGLDLSIIAAVAPGAEIRMYFAPNSFQSFVDAVISAVNDGCHIISISWGLSEKQWPSASRNAMNTVFQSAFQQGVAIFCAAGDYGATNGLTGLNVDFPGSSPHIVACGGTTVKVSNGSITSEVAWGSSPSSATGGGLSVYFNKPTYQSKVPLLSSRSKRGLPDIAANADPESGYIVRVLGQNVVIGGTSAVSPLLSALTALVNHKRSLSGQPSVGALNDDLYGAPLSVFRDVKEGGNFGYNAAAGWDFTTGLGAPSKELSDHLVGSGGGSVGDGGDSVVAPIQPSAINPPISFTTNKSPSPYNYKESITCTPSVSAQVGVSYGWNFGTGAFKASDDSPITIFAGFTPPQIYYGSLAPLSQNIIFDAYEAATSTTQRATQTVYMTGAPLVSFSTNPSPVLLNADIGIVNNTYEGDPLVVGATTYLWSFGGNNGTSTLKTPSFSYMLPGTYIYTITLKATSSNIPLNAFNPATATQSITVVDPNVVSSFQLTANSGFNPFVAIFTNTSSGTITDYLWNFGDNTSSSLQNPPNHQYDTPGTYTVSLQVRNSTYNTSSTSSQTITVYDSTVVANFTISPASGTAPLTVSLDPSGSTGSISQYDWNFGDGTIATTSTAVVQSKTYSNAGSYNIQLTVTSNLTSVLTISKTISLTVGSPAGPPICGLSNSLPGNFAAPCTITWTDASQANGSPITAWSWNLGEPGNPNNLSTLQNPPAISYQFAGSKVATLTVTNALGTTSCTKTVNITSTFTAPSASFTVSATRVTGQLITFTNTSTPNPVQAGSNTTYLWNFGNGVTTTVQSPTYTYSAAGNYTVSLQVTNYGGRSTSTQTITVAVNSVAVTFTTNPAFTVATRTLTINAGVSVTCANTTVSGSTARFVWSYGSGPWGSYPSASTSGLTAPPALVYNVLGTYQLSCLATQIDGSAGSSSITVVVNATTAAVSNFSMTLPNSATPTTVVTTVNRGVTFQLNQLSTNFPSSFTWNYNGAVDAVTGNVPSTSLRVPPPLKFPTTSTTTPVPIALTVSNSKNTAASVKTISYTVKGPLADNITIRFAKSSFALAPTVGGTPSSSSPVLWTWGDGTTTSGTWGTSATAAIRVGPKTYLTSGPFSATLKVDTITSAIVSIPVTFATLTTVALPSLSAAAGAPRTLPSLEDRRAQKEEQRAQRRALRESRAADAQESKASTNDLEPRAATTVSFTATKRNFVVQFLGSATNTPTGWAWTFTLSTNTATKVTAAVQNPLVTFKVAGIYNVQLVVTNANGRRTVKSTVTV